MDKPGLTPELLEDLLSGKATAPSKITGELVADLRSIRTDVQATIEQLQACEKTMREHQITLEQLRGAHNKTQTDLIKWYDRALETEEALAATPN